MRDRTDDKQPIDWVRVGVHGFFGIIGGAVQVVGYTVSVVVPVRTSVLIPEAVRIFGTLRAEIMTVDDAVVIGIPASDRKLAGKGNGADHLREGGLPGGFQVID